MKFSRYFMPTLKETPADAEVVSHQLMLRAGYIRKLATGIFSWLPMGLKVLKKVENIVRQEMNRIGAHEVFLPSVQPGEIWESSGRWTFYGKELLRFKDRHGHDYCLGPTHEEVITDIARREIHSYRDMPLNLYQIQTKFRDEVRPRFGIMRAREFLMKDAYSFDTDDKASANSYWQMHRAYQAAFTRLGLEFKVVEADSGAIGGSFSHEFMVLAHTGEDLIAACPACDYAANVEKASFKAAPQCFGEMAARPLIQVPTPGAHTIEQVAQMLQKTANAIAKTLIYLADGQPIAAMVRGDRELNEIKLKNLLNAADLVLAAPNAILEITGGPVGFSGPLGLDLPVYADPEVATTVSMVVGGNAQDLHLDGFNLERDAPGAKVVDLRLVGEGDACPKCGQQFAFARGIEVGHIFRLGTKYSAAMGVEYLNQEGVSRPIVMGCYGIGVSRIVAAAIEQGHDENGIILPPALAPFSVVVMPMSLSGVAYDIAISLHERLLTQGVDAALDDRDLRPGNKFKDSELVGIPYRIVVGPKGLSQGQVELKERKSGQTIWLEVDKAVEYMLELLEA